MKKIWIVKMAVLFILMLVVKSAILMGLWNWLVPDLFHGPSIAFLQALGLIVLSKILFSGFMGCRGGHHGMKHGWWGSMKERFEHMSPEERERLRALWKQRCSRMGSKGVAGEETPGT